MPGRRQSRGRIAEWDDARGFGFIRDSETGERLFLHISDVADGMPRPMLGDAVVYSRGEGRDGRPAAKRIAIVGASQGRPMRGAPARRGPDTGSVVRAAGAISLAVALLLGAYLSRVPVWLLFAHCAMSIVSFVLYSIDKAAAVDRRWRISETRLHQADMVFGVIGGLAAQVVNRHKVRKPGFAIITGIVFAIHAAIVGYLFVAGST